MVLIVSTSPSRDYKFRNGKTILYNYDKVLFQMIQMEQESYYIDRLKVSTTFGVCRAKPGIEIAVLALIESQFETKKDDFRPWVQACGVASITFDDKPNVSNSNSTLIIVPPYLYKQWLEEIVMYGLAEHLNEPSNDNCQACLIKSNKLNEFINNNTKFCFKRIVIVEADTINISVSRYIENKFVWFISKSTDLFHLPRFRKGKPLYNRFFRSFKYDWMNYNYFMIEIDDDILSIRKNVERKVIKCIEPFDYTNGLHNTCLKLIENNECEKAIISLGFKILTFPISEESLVPDVEAKTIRNIIMNKNLSLPQTCTICLDTNVNLPVLTTTCCGSTYCCKCMCDWLSRYKTSCPACRFQRFSMLVFDKEENVVMLKEFQIPYMICKKEKKLIDIIHSRENAKILLLNTCEYHNKDLKEEMTSNKISTRALAHNIDRVVNDHKNGKFQVLLVNDYYQISGLYMPWITDVIIYNRQSTMLEDDFVNRIIFKYKGEEKLVVHYLFYDHEID